MLAFDEGEESVVAYVTFACDTHREGGLKTHVMEGGSVGVDDCLCDSTCGAAYETHLVGGLEGAF